MVADFEAADRGERGAIKHSILTELGRLLDVAPFETVLYVAGNICEHKPSTKEAIARIRLVRLQRAPAPNDDALCGRIVAVINQYRREHPGMDLDAVCEVLNRVYCAVQELLEAASD
jgi:hypothetical protein